MDRFHNAIYGFAIGDAIGVPYAFKSRYALKNVEIKMIGYGTHDQPMGTYSDDTALMMATLDTMNKGYSLKELFGNLKSWYYKGTYAIENKIFDISTTTKKFLTLPFNPNVELKDIYSDNGSLRRMVPYAFYLMNEKKFEKKLKIISQSSNLTHPSKIADWGCFLYVEFFSYLINGMNKLVAYETLCQNYQSSAPNVYSTILSGKIHLLYESKIKSTGYVVDTLSSVLWSFLKHDSYTDILITAIKLGDNTDTIGALVGALAGFYYGDIPQDWLDNLRGKIQIEHLIIEFENKFGQNQKENNNECLSQTLFMI